MQRKFKTLSELTAFVEREHQRREDAAFHVTILHDDLCSPDGCVCSPEYVLEELTVDAVLKGAEAQKRWAEDSKARQRRGSN